MTQEEFTRLYRCHWPEDKRAEMLKRRVKGYFITTESMGRRESMLESIKLSAWARNYGYTPKELVDSKRDVLIRYGF